MRQYTTILTSACAVLVFAVSAVASIVWSEWDVDVLIIGELHDNPEHHAQQQNAVTEINPKAVVYEMLTPAEAEALAGVPRTFAAMVEATEGFHWSNIEDYAGVLLHSTVIVGAALDRDDMRAAFSDGAVTVFGPEAAQYGLTSPLDPAEQTTREDLQFEAHCAAMPRDMMSGMVEAQRLRDAAFARAVVQAVDTYGTPVILITGNGHARTDWGVPAYLKAARPDLRVESIGQGERDSPLPGTFDSTLIATTIPDRPDPCDAFK